MHRARDDRGGDVSDGRVGVLWQGPGHCARALGDAEHGARGPRLAHARHAVAPHAGARGGRVGRAPRHARGGGGAARGAAGRAAGHDRVPGAAHAQAAAAPGAALLPDARGLRLREHRRAPHHHCPRGPRRSLRGQARRLRGRAGRQGAPPSLAKVVCRQGGGQPAPGHCALRRGLARGRLPAHHPRGRPDAAPRRDARLRGRAAHGHAARARGARQRV